MPPTRQTISNRKRDEQHLQRLVDPLDHFIVFYDNDAHRFVVAHRDTAVKLYIGRYEVVFAFIKGLLMGWQR